MTDATITALATGLGTVITSAAVIIVAMRRTAAKTVEVVEAVKEVAMMTEEKVDQVHLLVNSRLDQALIEIKILREQLGFPSSSTPVHGLPKEEKKEVS